MSTEQEKTSFPAPTRWQRIGTDTHVWMNDGAHLVRSIKGDWITADSGQVSAFRPAQYIKPQAQGLIKRLVSAWKNSGQAEIDPSRTTEQGAASASSPVTYYLSLWEQRFGRRAMIEDCRSLYASDPRIKRSVDMYVDGATRGGVRIHVESVGDGNKDSVAKAQKIADSIASKFPAPLLRGWGVGLLLEGDLFVQFIADRGQNLVKVKRMPSISMERLTDDADEIIDEAAAFAQVDSMTFENVATFPAALMTHTRWSHIDGDRYGIPEIVTIRRNMRLLELMEQSQAVRRMTRAALKRHHKIGTPESPGSDQDLINYKNQNGFVEGDMEWADPMDGAASDVFSNGLVTIETLSGDANVSDIDDLLHFQNVLTMGLPTPLVLYGLDAQRVNRDIVDDLRELWLKSTVKLNDALDEPVSQAFEFQLITEGLNPDAVEYRIQWTISSLEQPGEVIKWVADGLEAGVFSRKTAIEVGAQFTGVTDIETEVKEIEKDIQKTVDYEVKKRSASITTQDKLDDENGKPKKRDSNTPK